MSDKIEQSKERDITNPLPEYVDIVLAYLVKKGLILPEHQEKMRIAEMNTRNLVGRVLQEKLLSAEIQDIFLALLQKRFEKDEYKLHEGIQWSEVEDALNADPQKIWSLYQMEITGGEPDVIADENGAFLFGDCSIESPIGRRNCTYDKEGEILAKERGKIVNNAVDVSIKWGTKLMTKDQWYALQKKIGMDISSYSFLDTPADFRNEQGIAFAGKRNGIWKKVYQYDAFSYSDDKGFRTVLIVKKV